MATRKIPLEKMKPDEKIQIGFRVRVCTVMKLKADAAALGIDDTAYLELLIHDNLQKGGPYGKQK